MPNLVTLHFSGIYFTNIHVCLQKRQAQGRAARHLRRTESAAFGNEMVVQAVADRLLEYRTKALPGLDDRP